MKHKIRLGDRFSHVYSNVIWEHVGTGWKRIDPPESIIRPDYGVKELDLKEYVYHGNFGKSNNFKII